MFCRFGSVEDSRPGRRDRLVIRRVHAPGARIHLSRQLVGVGGPQLRHAAVVEHDARQFVFVGQFLEHVLGRRGLAGRGLAPCRQAELAEQHFLQLLRRIDVERSSGGRVRPVLQFEQLLRQLVALLPEHRPCRSARPCVPCRAAPAPAAARSPRRACAATGTSSIRGQSVWWSRNVTSASSAEYSPAVSTGTSANGNCFAPLPATSS